MLQSAPMLTNQMALERLESEKLKSGPTLANQIALDQLQTESFWERTHSHQELRQNTAAEVKKAKCNSDTNSSVRRY
jgi:hypothetical protein